MTELLFLLKWAGIWLLVTVLAEWLTAACYPLFHRGIAPLNPALRSTARLLFSMTELEVLTKPAALNRHFQSSSENGIIHSYTIYSIQKSVGSKSSNHWTSSALLTFLNKDLSADAQQVSSGLRILECNILLKTH